MDQAEEYPGFWSRNFLLPGPVISAEGVFMRKTDLFRVISVFMLVLLFCAGTGMKSARADLIWPPAGFDGSETDYMVLVNKENRLPENWEEQLELVEITNSLGDDVQIEAKAYEAYLDLWGTLGAEGVFIGLDSAYRSVAEQQRIVEDFTKRYGEDYVKQYVAVPGFSEHHTGLALDLFLIIDGKDVYLNEDMVQYPEIWAKIHEKLAEFGFILRYPEGKEEITGYSYEPWHIRYIGDAGKAAEITEKGLTLEEYLGQK